MKQVTLNENSLKRIITESINKVLSEAESFGWVVETEDVDKAYEFFVDEVGEEEANRAIVQAMGKETLSKILAYLFRMYDLRGWDNSSR